mgnify:CR=1 FL=1
MNEVNFGWRNIPAEVEALTPSLSHPSIKQHLPPLNQSKEVLGYDLYRKVIGTDIDAGPQGIGDCVSWGFAGGVDYIQAVQIANILKDNNLLDTTVNDPARKAIVDQFQQIATEATYALSRVEVGKQINSYSDGSTGIWGSLSVTKWGVLSRKYLEDTLGPNQGKYNPNRAKQWGAKGLPDNLEPKAKQHLIKSSAPVTSFDEAAASIQNYYPVIICSNRGFTLQRDNQGFCKPQGTWYHCMKAIGVRWDRPGLLMLQSWGTKNPEGPLYKEQPGNSFWIDASVADYMLSQKDSYNMSQFSDFRPQDFTDWGD